LKSHPDIPDAAHTPFFIRRPLPVQIVFFSWAIGKKSEALNRYYHEKWMTAVTWHFCLKNMRTGTPHSPQGYTPGNIRKHSLPHRAV